MTAPVVDHLVFAAPDLDDGVSHVERLLGVTLEPGGRHEERGTRNRLLGLEGGAYLEVVAPDPEQPAPDRPRWFGIDTLSGPRLVTWAARVDGDLEAWLDRATAAGAELGVATAGGRRRPDGSELTWRFSDPDADRMGGTLPFLLDWGASSHPSASLATPCALAGLTVVHPDPERLSAVVEALRLPLRVEAGPEPTLVARLSGPRGVCELR